MYTAVQLVGSCKLVNFTVQDATTVQNIYLAFLVFLITSTVTTQYHNVSIY